MDFARLQPTWGGGKRANHFALHGAPPNRAGGPNGHSYRGNVVWPTKLRCVSCRASDPGDIYGNGDSQFDLKDASGAKFYTRFYHGRWVRR